MTRFQTKRQGDKVSERDKVTDVRQSDMVTMRHTKRHGDRASDRETS